MTDNASTTKDGREDDNEDRMCVNILAATPGTLPTYIHTCTYKQIYIVPKSWKQIRGAGAG